MLGKQKQSTQLPCQHSASKHSQSVSDQAIMKCNASIQQRLRKQLDSKFNKNHRKDQLNISSSPTRRKSSASLMFNNPLTKSTYSMNDSIIHKSALKAIVQPFQPKPALGSRSKVVSSFRQRYNSSIDSPFFGTRVENGYVSPTTPRLKPSLSARQIITRRPSLEHNLKSHM